MIFTKTLANDTFEDRIAEIFETSIVTDNISAIDGSVTFLSDVDTTNNVDIGGNLYNSGGNLSINSNIDLNNKNCLNTGYIDIDAISDPGSVGIGVDGGRLWAETGTEDLLWKTNTDEVILNNPYGQDLSTAGSPTFNFLTVTNDIDSDQVNTDTLDDNGAGTITVPTNVNITSGNNLVLSARSTNNTVTEILAVDSSDNVVIRDFSTFAGSDVFGTELAISEALSLSSTTSTSFVNKNSLVTGSVPAGNYYVGFTCLCYTDVLSFKTIVQFTENTVQMHVSPIVAVSYDQANDPKTCSLFFQTALLAGSYTYALNYRANFGTASISDSKIIFFRLS